MVDPLPRVRRIPASKRLLVGLALLANFAAPNPIPSAMARNLDSVGIGGMLGAGPVFHERQGLAPNQIIGQTWYHYRPSLVGGAGLEFSSRNPSRLRAYTSSRYDLTATWIPRRSANSLLELSLIAQFTHHSVYIDTATRAPGADAVEDAGIDWGLATRFGYGHRLSRLVDGWMSASPGVSYRFTGSNAGVNLGLDGELGMTISLQSIWYDAESLTRAWDVFFRIPFRWETAAPDVSANGPERVSRWRIGIQVGPTVLF